MGTDPENDYETARGGGARCRYPFLATTGSAQAAPQPEANKILAQDAANRALVRKAMTELFVHRDVSAVKRYFGSPYLQHNPTVGDGAEDLPKVVNALPANFKYEPGMIVADGEFVMIHGRYTGWGPKPLVTVDIFRVKKGKLVEHWDVMQEDVPASRTKSGRPMFPIAP